MQQEFRPLLITITGGIGSGKSTISNIIRSYGYEIFSADKIGHEILQEPKVILQLENQFGKEIIDNQQINRFKLSEIVFNNKENLAILNKITHPQIRQKMQNIIESATNEILFFEIPLLFESGMEICFDYTLNIHADTCKRIERVIKRDKVDSQKIINRINAQMNENLKISKADFTIYNNSDYSDLKKQVEIFIKRIPKLTKKHIIKITALK